MFSVFANINNNFLNFDSLVFPRDYYLDILGM